MPIKTRRKYKKRHLKTRKGGFRNSKKRFIKLVPLNKNKGLRKTKHSKFNKKNINLKRRSRIAGEAIASGTFGCVFKPALVCTDPYGDKFFKSNDPEYISKLMTNDEANKEIYEIMKIMPGIENIPDWQNYFIIAKKEEVCKINTKNRSNKIDLMNAADGKCEELLGQYGRNQVGLNQLGLDFMALNMRAGGDDLWVWLAKKRTLSPLEFDNINGLLIDLLKNAIIPMNKKDILHLDIKMGNILYDGSNVRLIDFGFATKFEEERVPKMAAPGILYSGAPFGNLLLGMPDDDEIHDILNYIKSQNLDIKNVANIEDIKKLIKNEEYDFSYLYNLLKYCEDVLEITSSDLEDKVLDSIIVILKNYDSSLKYFNAVFSKNADIFAFLIMYINFHNKMEDQNIKDGIKELIKKYILSSEFAATPYNPQQLIMDLAGLGKTPRAAATEKKEKDAVCVIEAFKQNLDDILKWWGLREDRLPTFKTAITQIINDQGEHCRIMIKGVIKSIDDILRTQGNNTKWEKRKRLWNNLLLSLNKITVDNLNQTSIDDMNVVFQDLEMKCKDAQELEGGKGGRKKKRSKAHRYRVRCRSKRSYH